MTAPQDDMDTYRLSSQQCGVHEPGWRSEPPVVAMLVEGAAGAGVTDALHAALRRLVEQHEILRTVYQAVPGLAYPVQCVKPQLDAAWLALDRQAGDEALLSAARSAIDLQHGPVLAASYARQDDGRLKWALAAASQALDAQSLQQLVVSCLAGTADSPELPHGTAGAPDLLHGTTGTSDLLQYPDYVAWQQELLASELGQEGGRFWQGRMTRVQPRLPFEVLGTGRRRPSEVLAPSAAATREVQALAQRTGLRVHVVLAGLWAGFMARLAQADGVAFDWLHTARADELAGALGRFDARLPVSAAMDAGMPAEALVRSVGAALQAAASWHECFDAAAFDEALARAGGARHRLSFSHIEAVALPPGWAWRHIGTDAGTGQLHCECIEHQGAWTLRWTASDAHGGETVRAWMRQFAILLEGLGVNAQRPWNRVPLIDDAERQRILAAAGQPGDARHADTLHGLFERHARHNPQAVALVCGDDALGYGELDAQAERLARRLRALGAGPEQVVGVYLGRSVQAIVAMLAVMKSGAAYVPLDPAYPAERIALMVEDARMLAVIVRRGGEPGPLTLDVRLVDVDDAHEDVAAATPQAVSGANLAYLIYTSGSTGRPKAVMVSHANAVASTSARFSFYAERVERFLLLSSFSFDSSVAGIFWTLGQGGTLCLPADGAQGDPAHVAALVARHGISHLLALPSLYKQIVEHLAEGHGLRCAIVAGEACHADLLDLHRQCAPQAVLVNEYGPTEGTVWSHAVRVDLLPAGTQRIPIGRAIPSMRSLVLDEDLEPCAVGLPGELYIGGDGIARGYRERPGLTALRFVADPFGPGQRLYRTGDLARLRPDGDVEYLGRVDHQVKLRGQRIELGEIEAVLLASEGVSGAAAMVHEDAATGQRLLAFVASHAVDTADAAEAAALRSTLEARLRARLPAFMVPAQIVVVPRLPAMPNGKVDRPALLALADHHQRPAYVAPCSRVECALAEIWQALLKVDRVGLDDDFFDLGGHSLLATQVTSRIRQRLSVDLPLRELFEVKTLKALAGKVEAGLAASRDDIALMDDLLAEAEGTR